MHACKLTFHMIPLSAINPIYEWIRLDQLFSSFKLFFLLLLLLHKCRQDASGTNQKLCPVRPRVCVCMCMCVCVCVRCLCLVLIHKRNNTRRSKHKKKNHLVFLHFFFVHSHLDVSRACFDLIFSFDGSSPPSTDFIYPYAHT